MSDIPIPSAIIAECKIKSTKRGWRVQRKEHPEEAFAIRIYSDPYRFLEEYRCDADLLLMDIQMPGMTGMAAAKRIRKVDPDVMILFITSLTQYAIAGYAVNAFDYIVKPLRHASFFAKIARVVRALDRSRSDVALTISAKEEKRRVPIRDILYIEVNNHDIYVHTVHETIQEWGSMKSIENQLRGLAFARCSVHYLIHLKYVQGVTVDEVILPKIRLPISRGKRKDFLNALAQYEGGGF